jgi:four helix bundle protein
VGVIRLSRDCWKPYAAALFAQLQPSSLSIQLNIAEGYSFGNTPTFTRQLGIACGSAVETVELLRLGVEAEVFPARTDATLLLHANRSCQLLLGLLKRRRRFKSS